jgi:hypothetical protein
MFVARYTSTGVLDTTFSGDGKAFATFTSQDPGLIHPPVAKPEWAILVSNQWPLPCEGSALPLS